MSNVTDTQRVNKILQVGKGPLTYRGALALVLAVVGSVIFRGNIIGVSQDNPNPSFLRDDRAFYTTVYAGDTGTGGLAKYDTILARSPYRAGSTAWGLRTGTGVVWYAQLDIIANPKAVKVDCTSVAGAEAATGGTLLFDNISATGSTNLYATPFTLGPGQNVKCGTLGTPGASFSGSLRLFMSDSDVVN